MKSRGFRWDLALVASLLIAGTALTEGRDDPLRNHDTSGREFKRVEIGDRTVYFHQRTVNGAIVEKDFIVYQFDTRRVVIPQLILESLFDGADFGLQIPPPEKRL